MVNGDSRSENSAFSSSRRRPRGSAAIGRLARRWVTAFAGKKKRGRQLMFALVVGAHVKQATGRPQQVGIAA